MFEIILALFIFLLEGLFFNIIGLSKEKSQKSFAFIIFIQLFIIAGFRHVDILNDSLTYAINFSNIDPNEPIFKIEGRFEPLYQILSKLIYIYVSSEPLALFVVTSIIIQFITVRFLYKYSNNLCLSVFLFITFRFYFFMVSGIRQGIAVALCFFAIDYLLKNKKTAFVFIVIFATMFHYSALIFLIIFFIKDVSFNFKYLFFIGTMTILTMLSMTYISNTLFSYMNYGKQYYEAGIELDSTFGATLITLNYLLVFLFGYLFKYKKLSSPTAIDNVEIWGIFIAFLIQALCIKFGILIRFTYYFAPLAVLIIPSTIKYMKSKEIKVASTVFWVIFSFMQFVIILVYRPEWYKFYPYKFYWD